MISNVNRLIIHKISIDAIPIRGDFMDGIKFLADKDRIIRSTHNAKEWVKLAIDVVRSAAEPNEWKEADDEVIAGEILRRIEERKKEGLG
jgi:hypothetical protein